MLNSMTGYGTSSGAIAGREVAVQIRSVNARYLDIYIKGPNLPVELEQRIRERLKFRVQRGRVDVLVETPAPAGGARTVNLEAAHGYLAQLQLLKEELQLAGEIRLADLLPLPGLLEGADPGFIAGEAVLAGFMTLLDGALDNFTRMRAQEGENLLGGLGLRLDGIETDLAGIVELQEQNRQHYFERLRRRLGELLSPSNPLDENRLAQEVAYLADRSDIAEEIDRFHSHLQQFRKALAEGSPAGKKLDFILQELNREINTVLSKTELMEISRRGLNIKAELEKIREQVQNIE